MRISIIIFIALFVGVSVGIYFWIKTIKFDAAVSISVQKGPFKNFNIKLVNYQIALQDLQTKNDFWKTELGQKIYDELSSTLQTLIQAAHKYVQIDIDVHYFGWIRRHYKVVEEHGKFVVVAG